VLGLGKCIQVENLLANAPAASRSNLSKELQVAITKLLIGLLKAPLFVIFLISCLKSHIPKYIKRSSGLDFSISSTIINGGTTGKSLKNNRSRPARLVFVASKHKHDFSPTKFATAFAMLLFPHAGNP
jgi:hypothetical protein